MDVAAKIANANSKVLRIERIVEARETPSPQQMDEIALIVDQYRAETGSPGGTWVRCSRCGKRVSNVIASGLGVAEWGFVVRAWVECPECIAAATEVCSDDGEGIE